MDTSPLRCDVCGVEATGIDEGGYGLCDRHAGERRGEDRERRESVGLMLRGAIAAARATGLPEADMSQVIADELDGPSITRLQEDVPRTLPDR
jgi:hypothetical protein